MRATKEEVKAFQREVWNFYTAQGRHTLPWRLTNDPYHILVSELMLQQTQVERVIPKFEAFIKKYPTAKRLAKAPLGEVLRLWQGLGYNRRAKYLHAAARYVENELSGVFPDTESELRALPGVGPYTAAAVAVFAFDKRVTLIETNVRQVMIWHFFPEEEKVKDETILSLVAATLPDQDFAKWYAALMDYGSHLKRVHGNLTRRSASYKKQSKFKGSDREIRGAIIKLLGKSKTSRSQLYGKLDFDRERITTQLDTLIEEELVVKQGGRLQLP